MDQSGSPRHSSIKYTDMSRVRMIEHGASRISDVPLQGQFEGS